MWFFNLIGGAKGILVLAILVALSGYIWKIKHDATLIQTELEKVTQQRDNAALARDEAVSANKTNQKVIAELQNEKNLIQDSLDNLKSNTTIVNNKTAKIKDNIKKQELTPENNQLLSPVLKDTINQIQANRVKP